MTTEPVGGRLRRPSSQTADRVRRSAARPFWLRALVLLLAGVAVLYLGRQALSVALAKDRVSDPTAALAARAHDSAALAAESERTLAGHDTPAGAAEARSLAAAALDRSPLEVGAIRILALAAQREGQSDRALALMTIAGRRSARDGPAQAWLTDYWYRHADWPKAMLHADLLLRTHPLVSKDLDGPLAAAATTDPAARKALIERLAMGPSWRDVFLHDMASANTDPAALLGVLNDLRRAHATLSNDELVDVLMPLVNRRLYDEAYLTWTQSIPPKALRSLGNVYDPNFKRLPGPAPFNWSFQQPNGGAVEITPAPNGGGGNALAVHLYETPAQPLATQLIALPSGRYVLTAQVLTDSGDAGGTAWSIRCAEGGVPIATISPSGNMGRWSSGSATFDVPQSNCHAQWLELRGQPDGAFRGAGVWWRGLAVNRAAQ
jgi:hypothetical protein